MLGVSGRFKRFFRRIRGQQRVIESESNQYFTNAHDFSIANLHINPVLKGEPSKSVFECLEPNISHGAAYDSAERSYAPRCAPKTREAVQGEIVSFMRHGDKSDPAKKIMYLSGPAGSGKTAIAGSVAETCQEEGLLAATFFFSSFSGSVDRHSKQFVVSTLAYHLAKHEALVEFKTQLLTSLERHPDIFRKRLREQAEILLLGPFQVILGQCDRTRWPTGIVLDGLDEVLGVRNHLLLRRNNENVQEEHEADQREILNLLCTLVQSPAFPFRILVSCRPERIFTEFFSDTANSMTVNVFLDSKYDPNTDIANFLAAKFADIRRRYGLSHASWPGKKAIDHIVQMSSGQFIVPATIIRQVSLGPPQRQLDNIINLRQMKDKSKNPFDVLDAVYRQILEGSPQVKLAVKWIRVIQKYRAPNTTGRFWRQFLEDEDGEVNYVLGPLTSLIAVPSTEQTSSHFVFYHKSLKDFLLTQSRCGDLYVADAEVDAYAGDRCVKVLSNKGPLGHGHPQHDVTKFLSIFPSFAGLIYSGKSGPSADNHHPIVNVIRPSLGHLSKESREKLISCDVGWWTHQVMRLRAERDRESDPYRFFGMKPFEMKFIASLYCSLHLTLCLSRTRCDEICIDWRRRILDQARSLGWCVHHFEDKLGGGVTARSSLDLNTGSKNVSAKDDRLSRISYNSFIFELREPGTRRDSASADCEICQPTKS
ncbi:hypothetical protein NMY22_g12706 [Coprinellus aureogranulatus]|nr:hypothetical protein NMY22_g12706 [Coprinellus aureogranulatus]